jgi:hypothetical protein
MSVRDSTIIDVPVQDRKMSGRVYECSRFHDFSIGIWDCSDSTPFFCFSVYYKTTGAEYKMA